VGHGRLPTASPTLERERGCTTRGKKLPKALVKRRIKIRAANEFKLPKRWENGWQQWRLDLLGTAPEVELAEGFGRTVTAVRVMRNRLGRRQP
jgi:hypothetical protein